MEETNDHVLEVCIRMSLEIATAEEVDCSLVEAERHAHMKLNMQRERHAS